MAGKKVIERRCYYQGMDINQAAHELMLKCEVINALYALKGNRVADLMRDEVVDEAVKLEKGARDVWGDEAWSRTCIECKAAAERFGR